MKTFLIILSAITFATFSHAELTIISTEHRETNTFKRFSEYFTGKENQGRYAIYRSVDEQRTGFYISLEAKSKAELSGVSKIRLQYVKPSTQEKDFVEFEVGDMRRKKLLVGLTEEEWQDANRRPVAWKVELLNSESNVLDTAQSFLWSE